MRIDGSTTMFMPMADRAANAATAPAREDETAAPSAPPPAPRAAAGADAGAAAMMDGEPVEKSLLEKILEHGFSQFAADLEKEKLAKMREEILGSMGITEEMLRQMSPEQRKQIENMVAAEIRKRLEAMSAINGGDEAQKGEAEISSMSIAATATTSAVSPPAAQTAISQIGEAGSQNTGLGVMLALQEAETAKAARASEEGTGTPGKKDRDDA